MAERLYRDSYDVQASAYESAGDASASIKRKLKQMGVDIFDAENGEVTLRPEKEQIRRLWDNY